ESRFLAVKALPFGAELLPRFPPERNPIASNPAPFSFRDCLRARPAVPLLFLAPVHHIQLSPTEPSPRPTSANEPTASPASRATHLTARKRERRAPQRSTLHEPREHTPLSIVRIIPCARARIRCCS